MPSIPRRSLLLQSLESRLAPASAITRALDLPDNTYVDVSQVRGTGLAVMGNTRVGGLGNFPTGPNNTFVVLSTGDATKAYGPRGDYPAEGRDWGLPGSADDQQYMRLTIPTLNGEGNLRFDLNFMTDEVPGLTNEFNDQFVILATPIGAGTAQTVAEVTVNDNIFMSGSPVNSIYARQTGCYTVDYAIPAGAIGVTLEIVLDDRPFTFNTERTGYFDSALVLDNFRFVKRQTVWLNFDGGPIEDDPVENATTTFPAFQPADIRSSADRATLIDSIVAKVEEKYAAYNIDFTTTQPTTGPYSTMMIGGTAANTITLHPDADPRLIEAYGSTLLIQQAIGMNPFGYADSDYGNPDLDTTGAIFSGKFAVASVYNGQDAAELEKRLAVTIAHEVAHSVGTPHVKDSFDNNIMAQYSPRSPDAIFETERRDLPETLPDGRTSLNVHGYLISVLGAASGVGFVNGAGLSAFGGVYRATLGLNIYDFRIGHALTTPDTEGELLDTGVTWYEYDVLRAGTTEIEIPHITPESHLIFYGSTTPGGPIDFFSGIPTAGTMTFDQGFVPMFDTNGVLNSSLPAATGALGSLVPLAGGVGFSASPYTIPGLQPLPKTGLTFTDDDGDTVTVKLASKTGTALVQIVDPDGDGRGHLGTIELQDTQSKDKLTISVKKNKVGGDGFTSVGAINGSALGSIAAKQAHLDGDGVSIFGAVKSMTFRDVRNGADILTGGDLKTTTALTVHDVADGTTIDVGGRLKLTAARIGDGTIEAAMLTKLAVKGDTAMGVQGDFKSDVTIVPGPGLAQLQGQQNMLGSVGIAGRTIGATFTVPGNVGSFRTGTFEDSALLVGFTPTDALNPLAGGTWDGVFKVGSFKAIGFNGYTGPTYANSHVIAAKLGSVTLATVAVDNGGTAFGFAAQAGLAKNRTTIVLQNPATKILGSQPLPFTLTDFNVLEL